jgi:glycogen synthase
MSPSSEVRPSKRRRMIVFVTFETEFTKSGGLGAVMSALPRRMAQYEESFVIAPHFEHIVDLDELARRGKIKAFSKLPSFSLVIGGRTYVVGITQVTAWDGFRTYFLSSDGFFTARVDPYVNSRDPARPMDPNKNPIVPEKLTEDALFFCAAVPKALAQLGMTKDLVLQLQDWETACAAQAVKMDSGIRSGACVLTLHNPYDRFLGHVGSELMADLVSHLGLRGENVLTQMIPLMDGSLSTVSQNFAGELTTDSLLARVFAEHLQGLFVRKGVVGIDNGIFGDRVFPFSPEAERWAKQGSFQGIQQEKWERRMRLAEVLGAYQRELAQDSDPNQQAWGAEFDLSDPRLPVFLVMGRDDPRQKGFDVVTEAIRRIPEGRARYIFTPMPGAEGLVGLEFLRKLAWERAGEVKVFPFRLAPEPFQALQQGSSFMVMGSLYEPFGAANEAYLAGMPVVARATGGLVQQVVPYSRASLSPYGRQRVAAFHEEDSAPTGFLFREPRMPGDVQGWREIIDCSYWDQSPRGDRIDDDRKDIPLFSAMVGSATRALQEAIDFYTSDQQGYARMIYSGFEMLDRFSWERAVRGYRRLYDQVCEED